MKKVLCSVFAMLVVLMATATEGPGKKGTPKSNKVEVPSNSKNLKYVGNGKAVLNYKEDEDNVTNVQFFIKVGDRLVETFSTGPIKKGDSLTREIKIF